MNKIISKKQLEQISKLLKKQNKKLVTTNGSFDLIHPGHLIILEEAKNQGDILIVGLNSDKSVKSYKGEKRPIISEENRAKMLASLKCVDYVIVLDKPEISIPLIELVKPTVHVNGSEYGKNCIESEKVKEINARLHLVNKINNLSTTNIIKKIKEF